MSDTHSRWTGYLPLDELARAPRNPKGHADAEITASLKRFGYVEQITLDERTGRIASGHGRLDRLMAAQAAGEPPPEGIDLADDGSWIVPVNRGWRSANDAEAEAYLIASNQLTIAGGWDNDAELAAILQATAETAAGLIGTGFDRTEIDLLLARAAGGGPTDPDAEWEGMPEFSQADLAGKYATTIHFLTEADALRFWKEVLGQDRPRRTTWWPVHDGFEGSSQKLAYVAEEDDGAAPAVPDLHPVEE